MIEDFNPYLEWLKIPLIEQPPNYYTLLGIPFQESNPEVIRAAANSRMQLVRSFQTGPRGDHTQYLLNELTQAKICLLQPSEKFQYDSRFEAASLLPGASPSAVPQHVNIQTDNARENVSFVPDIVVENSNSASEPSNSPTFSNEAAHAEQVSIATGAAEKVNLSRAPIGAENLEDEKQPKKRQIKIPMPVFAGFWVLTIALAVLGLGRFFSTLGQAERDAQAQKQKESDDFAEKARQKPTVPIMDGKLITTDSSNNYLLLAKNIWKSKGDVETDMTAGVLTLTNWSEEDEASWKLNVKVPSSFKVEIDYLANGIGEKTKLIFYVEDRKKVVFLRESEENKFNTDLFYILLRRPNETEIRMVAKDVEGTIAVKSIRIFPRTR